jgi:Secretion system C-terminal sorting domain
MTRTLKKLNAIVLLVMLAITTHSQGVGFLEGGFGFFPQNNKPIHAADLAFTSNSGMMLTDFAPQTPNNPTAVHRLGLHKYLQTGMSPIFQRQYLFPTESLSDELDSNRSFIANEIKEKPDKGFIICGTLLHKNSITSQYGFLLNLDSNGVVIWFRLYEYPVVGGQQVIGFNTVEIITSGTGTAQGFVVAGYRLDKVNNRKIARVMATNLNGQETRIAELSEINPQTNVFPGSEFLKMIRYQGDSLFALTGSAFVTNQLLGSSDMALSIFNSKSGLITTKRYGAAGSTTFDGQHEKGVSLVRIGKQLAVVADYRIQVVNATRRVHYFFINPVNPENPSTWTITTQKRYDFTNTLMEIPKDIVVLSGFTPIDPQIPNPAPVATNPQLLASCWILGHYDANRSFLLKVNAGNGNVQLGPELYASTFLPLKGNALDVNNAGNLIFYGEANNFQDGDLIERVSPLVFAQCAVTTDPVNTIADSIKVATIRSKLAPSLSSYQILQEAYYEVGEDYPCGGNPPHCRRSNSITNVEVLPENGQLGIYPNPVKNRLQLTLEVKKAERISLSVITLTGQLVAKPVQNREYPAGIHLVNYPVESLQPGSYYIMMETDAGRSIKKFVKL